MTSQGRNLEPVLSTAKSAKAVSRLRLSLLLVGKVKIVCSDLLPVKRSFRKLARGVENYSTICTSFIFRRRGSWNEKWQNRG